MRSYTAIVQLHDSIVEQHLASLMSQYYNCRQRSARTSDFKTRLLFFFAFKLPSVLNNSTVWYSVVKYSTVQYSTVPWYYRCACIVVVYITGRTDCWTARYFNKFAKVISVVGVYFRNKTLEGCNKRVGLFRVQPPLNYWWNIRYFDIRCGYPPCFSPSPPLALLPPPHPIWQFFCLIRILIWQNG